MKLFRATERKKEKKKIDCPSIDDWNSLINEL